MARTDSVNSSNLSPWIQIEWQERKGEWSLTGGREIQRGGSSGLDDGEVPVVLRGNEVVHGVQCG
jgi:hypothetical protein